MTVSDHPSTSTTPAPPLVHDIPEAADWLRCGRSTVYKLLETDEIKGIKIGRRRLVTHDSLVAFVARQVAS
ncbi:helix-turn-helix domain-containing protein [Nocardioides sp. JQ2195]|uniref:helix-turn-helix domain-containing protein n=1 Tax=Nocardioides sp. JQ2195 TaxID=2592334 RepID=UPI00143EC3FF|nr:helix-turn-helix domain-containing protein [Nocardioides sp. JQ2195]QIX27512.1 helix-turn-helix domain-containing protein [Nocardioides sp. JQ2195]